MTRDTYADCGSAIRIALEQAVRDRLTFEQYRALAAVIALTASYSRLTDSLRVADVAAAAGLHPENAGSALRRLRDLGLVVYDGGRGRPVARIGLPVPPRPAASAGLRQADAAGLNGAEQADAAGLKQAAAAGLDQAEQAAAAGLRLVEDKPPRLLKTSRSASRVNRTEKTYEKRDVDDARELEKIIAPLGPLSASQRRLVETAWSESPDGVLHVLDTARGPGIKRPVGLLVEWLRAGEHRRPLPVARRAVVCDECEVGGGLHVAGCSRSNPEPAA